MHTRSLQPEFDLRMKIELEDPTRLVKLSKQALIDCGATDSFVDNKLVEHLKIPIQQLDKPIPVYQLDREKTSAGDITGFVDLSMKIGRHVEMIRFYVTKLGKMDIFLGYSWLRKHNPEINWVTKRMTMTCCPAECREGRGAVLTLEQDPRESHNPDMAKSPGEEGVLEDETIYTMMAKGESTMPTMIRQLLIRATQTKATEIAAREAEKRKDRMIEEQIPEWIRDYQEVFEPKGFEELPLRRQWDHEINLKEGSQPWTGVRVIPLS